ILSAGLAECGPVPRRRRHALPGNAALPCGSWGQPGGWRSQGRSMGVKYINPKNFLMAFLTGAITNSSGRWFLARNFPACRDNAISHSMAGYKFVRITRLARRVGFL